MLSADLLYFWNIARAILQGLSPYSVANVYPPATSYLFVVFGLLSFQAAAWGWAGVNLLTALDIIRRLPATRLRWLWLLFSPLVFIVLDGQNDLVFLWLALNLERKDWRAGVAAGLILLKPQIAFVVLPWYLIRWLLHDRKQIVRFAGLTALLVVFPLVIRPGVYLEWLAAAQAQTALRFAASPGLFAFTTFAVPIWIPAVLGGLIALAGLWLDPHSSWAAQLLALPGGRWYDSVLLLNAAPVWFAVPLSWLTFALAAWLKNSVPLVLIPVGILLWRVLAKTGPFRYNTENSGG